MLEKTLFNWLTSKGYECFRNFPLGGKFPDLIAIKNKEIIAFELKKRANEIPKAMGQCLFYLNDANKVFIVLPEKQKGFLSDSTFETFKKQGIGLMIGDHTLKVLVNAKKISKNNIPLIKKIRKKKALVSEKIKKKANNIEEQIKKILKNHPEGLTVLDIAKYVDINRVTAAKYIYGLIAGGLVYQRRIGSSKLCYLKRRKK